MRYPPSAAYSQVPSPADTVNLSCTVTFPDHQRSRGTLALTGEQLRCEMTSPAKRGTRRMRSDGRSP
jgi:hypothetical protein